MTATAAIGRHASSEDRPLVDAFERWCRSRARPGSEEAAATVARALAEALTRGSICVRPGEDPAVTADVVRLMEESGLAVREAETKPDSRRVHPIVIGQGGELYLRRYWRYEVKLAQSLADRVNRAPIAIDASQLRSELDRLFPPGGDGAPNLQKVASALAVLRHLCIVSGGPGTGKTTTLTGILAALHAVSPGLSVALAAPTGRAADRMGQAIRSAAEILELSQPVRDAIFNDGSTIHRLLGSRRNSSLFRHDRRNPLPHDIVVIDEASMVSLPLMAKLVDAVRPDARLILLGDHEQLASVEAGRVLADICQGLTGFTTPMADLLHEATGGDLTGVVAPEGAGGNCLVTLTRNWRFKEDDGIAALANGVRTAECAPILLAAQENTFTDLDVCETGKGDAAIRRLVRDWAFEVVRLAREGKDGEALDALKEARILTPYRTGVEGVDGLNRAVEGLLAAEGLIGQNRSYAGRPIIITANDRETALYNGDVGITVPAPCGGLCAYFVIGGQPTWLALSRLPPHETTWAMTVHKAQGSEYPSVLFVFGDGDARLATRELIYTAVTRARKHLTIVTDLDRFGSAVGRQMVRTTGLSERLAARLPA